MFIVLGQKQDWLRTGAEILGSSLSLVILLVFFWNRFSFIKRNFSSMIPLFGILSFFIISQINLSYRPFDYQILDKFDYKNRISQSDSLEKANVVANGLKLVANASKEDVSRGLTIFFDFKNRFKDRFKPSDDDLLAFTKGDSYSFKKATLKVYSFNPCFQPQLLHQILFHYFSYLYWLYIFFINYI